MDKIKIDICNYDDPRGCRLEYDVFLASGYIKPNPRHIVEKYVKYPNATLLVCTYRAQVAGVVRLLFPDTSHPTLNLPTINEFNLWDEFYRRFNRINPQTVLEYGTMSIAKPFRGSAVTKALRRKMFIYPFLRGYRHAISLIDEGFFQSLKRDGYPFKQIGDARYFMGSNTVPVMVSAADLYQTAGLWIKRFLASVNTAESRML